MQLQQPGPPPKKPGRKSVPLRRILLFAILFLTILLAAIIWIFFTDVPWFTTLPVALLTVLGVVVGLLQWLFPISNDENKQGEILPIHTSTMTAAPVRRAVLGSASIALPSSAGQFHSVFLFNEPLIDAKEFYGRQRERTTLINRTRKGASTSLVGSRKIGKTWLLKYLALVAPAELGSHFHIGYLDATSPSCKTIVKFTSSALAALGSPASSTPRDLDKLEREVRTMKLRSQTPVLCIDEFDSFQQKPGFDLDFFKDLRAIAGAGLVIVTASKSPLFDIIGDPERTSPFFNIFEQLQIKPFSSKEATGFAAEKSLQANFTDRERAFLLQYAELPAGQWPPLRLQLVGKMLEEELAQAASEHYDPADPAYWDNFMVRLNEVYRGTVR